MTHEALIFDAIRTPRGKGKTTGALHEVKPVTLLAHLLTALHSRNQFDTVSVDDIVMGCVTAIGDQGAVIAKTAAMAAGWDNNVAGMVLNRFCASGLEAVNIAAMKIRSGWENLVVAGGVESMSRVPMGYDGGAWAMDPETNIHSGFMPQGIGADLIATLDGYSRTDIDTFAILSHQKAAQAVKNGAFSKAIIPITDRNGLAILAHDELIRANCSLESLAQLKPSFKMMADMGFKNVIRKGYPQIETIKHLHTPGNSSGIVDGAAALLIGNKKAGQEFSMQPRARIVATALVGTDPTIMLTGPAPAARKALNIANMHINDIDLFEVNEAFSSVVMRFMREFDLNPNKVNVNGGAIAMGHPLGATGAIMIGTLLDELEARDLSTGLATLCVGAGMGIATIIERI